MNSAISSVSLRNSDKVTNRRLLQVLLPLSVAKRLMGRRRFRTLRDAQCKGNLVSVPLTNASHIGGAAHNGNAALKRWLRTTLVGLTLAAAQPALALCPFHIGPSGAPSGTATTDGLLFLRFSQDFVGPDAVVGAALPGSVAPDVITFIRINRAALDVDGDRFITEFDMMVITRYLFGFRGDALVRDLPTRKDAQRVGGAAIQSFIDGGCLAPSADPRINVWNAMNAQLAQGTAGGIEAAKQYMTPTAIDNYGAALTLIAERLPALIDSYGPMMMVNNADRFADYLIAIPVPYSPVGEKLIHVVTFLKTDDGRWLIDTM